MAAEARLDRRHASIIESLTGVSALSTLLILMSVLMKK
jgi:hypothetical protein